MKGVFLKEGELVGMVDPDTGTEQLDQLEDERAVRRHRSRAEGHSPDSNRKILEELKKYALEHEQKYGRFPKTLIFAANDVPHTSHADQLVRLAVEVFGRGESFVRKITGRVDRPLQHIREFRNRPKPGIVVTVDLLSTGVDIPDLEFIVFLRPVKSRILFEQMLGRGTRKGEKFPDKSHFTVFDCFDGTLLAYFRNSTGMTADPPTSRARTIKEIIDDIWAEPRPRLQHPLPGRGGCSGSRRRWPARRGRYSPPSALPTATWPLRRRSCPAGSAATSPLPCGSCGTKSFRDLLIDYPVPSGSLSGPWKMRMP